MSLSNESKLTLQRMFESEWSPRRAWFNCLAIRFQSTSGTSSLHSVSKMGTIWLVSGLPVSCASSVTLGHLKMYPRAAKFLNLSFKDANWADGFFALAEELII